MPWFAQSTGDVRYNALMKKCVGTCDDKSLQVTNMWLKKNMSTKHLLASVFEDYDAIDIL